MTKIAIDILQCSNVAQNSLAVLLKDHRFANFLEYISAVNYQNWFTPVEVKSEDTVGAFLRCSIVICL